MSLPPSDDSGFGSQSGAELPLVSAAPAVAPTPGGFVALARRLAASPSAGAAGELPWPPATPREAFAERRARLAERFPAPCVFTSGLSRVRNFPQSRHPHRAESHFAYLVGEGPEGALLRGRDGHWCLFVPEPEPEEQLWTGPQPSLASLEATLGLPVRPLAEFEPEVPMATLPPQDADTALWLEEVAALEVEPGGGDALEGADAALADAMIACRALQDPAALVQLRHAARVTVLAHRAGMASTRPGLREAAVRAVMEAVATAHGCAQAYPPIVTVRGEHLHAHRHDRVMAAGELLLCDVGAETPEGWAADVTRTWPVTGRFSPTQRALYDVVLAAHDAAIERVRPGVRFLEVHRAASLRLLEGLIELGIARGRAESLYEQGLGAVFFPHGVGHLLGLDVHDLEDLGDRAGYPPGRTRSERPGERLLRLDRDLEAGMLVTIEPGFYRVEPLLEDARQAPSLGGCVDWQRLEHFSDVRGIRIEDDVLVTPSGAEVLTAALPTRAEQVEALVGAAL